MSTAFRQYRRELEVPTRGRGTYDISTAVMEAVRISEVGDGMCNVFVHHTSASLIICENADPAVRSDLERYMSHLVIDGDRMFEHTDEGPDDMPAHIRSILTQSSLSVPVISGRPALGTWQGIYLWEHRHNPHRRRLTITVQGS